MKADSSPHPVRGTLCRAIRAPRILGGCAMILLAVSNLYWMRSTLFGRAPSRAVLQWLSTASGGFLNGSTLTLGSCLLLGMGLVLLVIGIVRLILIEDRQARVSTPRDRATHPPLH